MSDTANLPNRSVYVTTTGDLLSPGILIVGQEERLIWAQKLNSHRDGYVVFSRSRPQGSELFGTQVALSFNFSEPNPDERVVRFIPDDVFANAMGSGQKINIIRLASLADGAAMKIGYRIGGANGHSTGNDVVNLGTREQVIAVFRGMIDRHIQAQTTASGSTDIPSPESVREGRTLGQWTKAPALPKFRPQIVKTEPRS